MSQQPLILYYFARYNEPLQELCDNLRENNRHTQLLHAHVDLVSSNYLSPNSQILQNQVYQPTDAGLEICIEIVVAYFKKQLRTRYFFCHHTFEEKVSLYKVRRKVRAYNAKVLDSSIAHTYTFTSIEAQNQNVVLACFSHLY